MQTPIHNSQALRLSLCLQRAGRLLLLDEAAGAALPSMELPGGWSLTRAGQALCDSLGLQPCWLGLSHVIRSRSRGLLYVLVAEVRGTPPESARWHSIDELLGERPAGLADPRITRFVLKGIRAGRLYPIPGEESPCVPPG